MNLIQSFPVKYGFYIFWIIALLSITGVAFQYQELAQIAKLLSTPTLSLYYLSGKNRSNAYFLILFFSWIGDVLILSSNFSHMLSGIIVFWGVLLILLDTMAKELRDNFFGQFKKKYALMVALAWVVYLIIILMDLYENLGLLFWPILFYGIILIGTGFMSVMLWIEQRTKTTLSLMIGITLLIFSGTFLSNSLFVGETNFLDITTEISYIGSQFFICYYFIYQPAKQHGV